MEEQGGWKVSRGLRLHGNHRACQRGDQQDGLGGAGPWGVTQALSAVVGQLRWALASNLGKCDEHQLFSRDPRHPFPPFSLGLVRISVLSASRGV